MKIAILSRNKNLYSTKRFKETGEARGHQVDIIDTLHCYCYMDITRSKPTVRYHGEQLPQAEFLTKGTKTNLGEPKRPKKAELEARYSIVKASGRHKFIKVD